ncbi:DUF4238 domain-containing protein [Aliarcobacter butzleri]|uniref:DUF4238 domain-containing protein n=1 Tax=Aliarcobacter butzleri TaxID=28197 RepID=UPI001EDBD4D6|nr:DUF4238 domain-containing protein [Aliarcobacter butzleri]MCG3709110.1 DUF4238 domain-containing protein [Aliarcobacter butzleri]
MKITKKQHYVSKFYLRAWIIDEKENLFCLMNKKIFLSNILNLVQERYFYEIKEISLEEIDFLKKIIFQNKNTELIESLLSVINTSNSSFKLIRNTYLLEKDFGEKVENMFKKDLKEHHENYFAELEDKAAPLFKKLQEEDNSFLNNFEDKKDFLLHISAQYFRTKNMKENLVKVIENTKYKNINIENIFTIISIYFSINLASNINEKNYNIVFIKNLTNRDFITSDQPIINVWKMNNPEKHEIEAVELYMPIAPKLAILISESIYDDLEISDIEELKKYNDFIVKSSLTQIFSSNKEQLEHYV